MYGLAIYLKVQQCAKLLSHPSLLYILLGKCEMYPVIY